MEIPERTSPVLNLEDSHLRPVPVPEDGISVTNKERSGMKEREREGR